MSPDRGTQAVCPRYHRAVELIGRRWSGAIVRVLLDGPRRFTEILEQVDDLTDRLLSERLKELEAEGVVARRVYPETPVRIEYALTEKDRDLERVVPRDPPLGGPLDLRPFPRAPLIVLRRRRPRLWKGVVGRPTSWRGRVLTGTRRFR